jgi:hypothetical protein
VLGGVDPFAGAGPRGTGSARGASRSRSAKERRSPDRSLLRARAAGSPDGVSAVHVGGDATILGRGELFLP